MSFVAEQSSNGVGFSPVRLLIILICYCICLSVDISIIGFTAVVTSHLVVSIVCQWMCNIDELLQHRFSACTRLLWHPLLILSANDFDKCSFNHWNRCSMVFICCCLGCCGCHSHGSRIFLYSLYPVELCVKLVEINTSLVITKGCNCGSNYFVMPCFDNRHSKDANICQYILY